MKKMDKEELPDREQDTVHDTFLCSWSFHDECQVLLIAEVFIDYIKSIRRGLV